MKRILTAFALLSILAGGAALATEEPRYTASLRAGDMEVRDYPALIAAEVTVAGDRQQAVSAGFRLLAGYIFGGNVRKQSIAMTAPVVQTRASGESIPMTAPVTQTAAANGWVIRFIMPSGYTMATLPTPKDGRVRLVPLPPARLAVAKFSGLAGESDIRRQTAALEAFVGQHHLRPTGPPSLSRYDPPWTPWFMRRNEIWIPVAPAG